MSSPINIGNKRRNSNHWWFDRHQTGVYNSSPPSRYVMYPGLTSSPSQSQSIRDTKVDPSSSFKSASFDENGFLAREGGFLSIVYNKLEKTFWKHPQTTQ